MKKYNKLITSSLLIALVLSTPAFSFADNNKNNNGNKERTEETNRLRTEENNRERNNLANWFGSNWFKSKNSKNSIVMPVISNLTATSNKEKKATIKWNTNLRSNSLIWYSTTPGIDTTKAPNIKRGDRVLKHKFELSKLQPNTVYYVVVGSANNGGTAKSSEISFTTNTVNVNRFNPVITGIVGPLSLKVGELGTYTVNAYDPQNRALTYSVDWGDKNTIPQTTFNQTVVLTHSYAVAGTYNAKFTLTNIDEKKTTSYLKIVVQAITTPDTKAPVINEIETKISKTNVTISWETDEPSTSKIFYSTVTPVVIDGAGTLSVSNESLVKKHVIQIPNLTSSTLYHFILKSADASNNVGLSSESAFRTN